MIAHPAGNAVFPKAGRAALRMASRREHGENSGWAMKKEMM
jgi:hypothetical protein